MSIVVHFPAMLHPVAGRELRVDEPVANVGELLAALERLVPGLGAQLADPVYNVAVNDDMLLHGVNAQPLRDGDIVEIIPTIAGGSPDRQSAGI
jgi:molybdopterin converting factor small subunit